MFLPGFEVSCLEMLSYFSLGLLLVECSLDQASLGFAAFLNCAIYLT